MCCQYVMGLQTSLAASGNDDQIITPTDYQYHRCVPVSAWRCHGRRRQRTEKGPCHAMPCNLRGSPCFQAKATYKKDGGRRERWTTTSHMRRVRVSTGMATTAARASSSKHRLTCHLLHLFWSLHTKRNALCAFLGSMVKVHACAKWMVTLHQISWKKNMTTSALCSSASGNKRAFIIFVKKNAWWVTCLFPEEIVCQYESPWPTRIHIFLSLRVCLDSFF